MLGFGALGEHALGRHDDAESFVADQAVPTPTTSATALHADAFAAIQTVPVPETTATVLHIEAFLATQAVPAPISVSALDADITWTGNPTIPVPAQVAELFNASPGLRIRAQREGYTFIARRIEKSQPARRKLAA